MHKPWRRQAAVVDDGPPKRRTQSSSAELQPSGAQRRQRLLAKDRYRVVVMGAAAVGKTCIISRLLYERFVSEYKATVEELHSGDYELDGRPVTLDILPGPFQSLRALVLSLPITVYILHTPCPFSTYASYMSTKLLLAYLFIYLLALDILPGPLQSLRTLSLVLYLPITVHIYRHVLTRLTMCTKLLLTYLFIYLVALDILDTSGRSSN